MNHKRPSDSKTQRWMRAVIYWLILGIGALFAILCIVLDHKSSVTTKISAVGASLLSAVIFGVLLALYNRVSEFHFEDLIRSILKEFHRNRDQSISYHVPSKEYPPTDSFDPVFMSDLMKDLSDSKTFWYRGSSGTWVAPYLKYNNKNLLATKVIILDPKDDSAINLRAADRMRIKKNANRDILAKELRQEIKMAVVSLFDARTLSPIKIFLSGSVASPVGINITEKSVYVGLQFAGRVPATRIPQSYRYENDSLAYQSYRVELERQSSVAREAGKIFEFYPNQGEEKDLKNTLEIISGIVIEEDEIKKLRYEAKTFQAKFFENMKDAAH